MNGDVVIEDRREPRGAGVPGKSQPESAALGPQATQRPSGDAERYPEKCNPRGRRSPLTEEQRRLVVRYLPLARLMVSKSGLRKPELDELISAAYLALVEAAESFDPDYGVNFATFARHRIRGAMSNCRRAWFRLAMQGDGIPSPVFRRLGTREETHGWVLGKSEETHTIAEFEETEALESYFRRLPRNQATACRLIYLDGKSQAEVADLLGYSQSYLSRLHQNALESLRRCS